MRGQVERTRKAYIEDYCFVEQAFIDMVNFFREALMRAEWSDLLSGLNPGRAAPNGRQLYS